MNNKCIRIAVFVLMLSGSYPLNIATAAGPTIAPDVVRSEAGQQPRGLFAALQAAVTLHPSAKGKQAELDAQGFAINSAEAGRYPSISAEADNLYDDYDKGTVRVSQPLWAFGKIDTQIDLAEAKFIVDQSGLLAVQRELIEETAAAYAVVEGIKQREEVAKVNIAEHEQLYQQIQRRQAGQLASETDVRLAHSRIILARSQYTRIKGEMQVALTELHSLTQIEVDVGLPVDRSLADLPSLPVVEALALKNNATAAGKRALLKVAQLDIKKEKVASLPTVYARVEYEFLDIPENTDSTRFGIVVEGNLDGLGLFSYGRIKSAAARLNAAQEDLNVALNDVRRRVNALMLNRNVQLMLLESQREAVEVVEETKASFLRQYESGRKTWLDVLNIQRELTTLRFQLAQIENDWLILSMRVAALTGGLDQLAGVKSL